MQAIPPGFAVEEIQGLYGPFTFSEKLFQQIWARGDFSQSQLATADGRRLKIVHAGRWNLLGGPDFRDARLRFDDGAEIAGDVELHLHAADWAAHRHVQDHAYDRVQLHVVLFPPAAGYVTRGAAGREIPVLVLLPLLHHDLEEYATEAAIEALAGRPLTKAVEGLRHFSPDALAAELRTQAERRWRQKVCFARTRIAKLGWTVACHHAALEILGYRFNRAPMLRLAARHELAAWAGGAVDPAAAFAEAEGRWSLQGVRPANHPRTRLRQYAAWAAAVPDWPDRLAVMGVRLPRISVAGPATTAEMRRAHQLTTWRKDLAQEICGGQVGGTRMDNLVCDGWLPLLAAQGVGGGDLGGLWWHWFPGDLPPFVTKALRDLGMFAGRASPACHGAAQGLVGRMLAQEIRGA